VRRGLERVAAGRNRFFQVNARRGEFCDLPGRGFCA